MLASKVHESIHFLDDYILKSEFRGYDPYDVLNSPFLGSLGCRNNLVGVAFIQIGRNLPVLPRLLLRMHPVANAKTSALLARAYLLLFKYTQQQKYLDSALSCLDWLISHRSPGFNNACWGYSFPWATMHGFVPRESPNTVCTAFVAHALLDAYDLLGKRAYLTLACSACDFLLQDVLRFEYKNDEVFCFGYTTRLPITPVHNANLLACSVISRVGAATHNIALTQTIMPALKFTLNQQNADGSWYYLGNYSGRGNMIDNFHTGFNLEALRMIQKYAAVNLQTNIDRGQQFYETQLFDPNGQPYRKIGKRFPVDIRDAAELLIVLGQLGELVPFQQVLLQHVLNWTFDHMRIEKGYFGYQRWPKFLQPGIYLRWQAWMLLAMANILPLVEVDN